jgi:DNA repair exonuclease SbcCD ATPase subunit
MELKSLREGTTPLTLVEGPAPEESFVVQIFNNKKTRTARKRLHETVESQISRIDKLQLEMEELGKQRRKLDKGPEIEEKRAEMAAAEESGEAAEVLAALSADLEKLEKQQTKLEGKRAGVLALEEQAREKVVEVEAAAQRALAEQIAFFVESSNITDDGQPVPSDAGFFENEFDTESLFDFLNRVGTLLDGPLARRRTAPSASGS